MDFRDELLTNILYCGHVNLILDTDCKIFMIL